MESHPNRSGTCDVMRVKRMLNTRYFSGFDTATVAGRTYDVTPDGRRFLMVEEKERPPIKATQMILVQNWFEELKRLVPTR